MEYFELILSFVIGLVLVLLLALIFSLKTKGIKRLVINALAGAAVLVLLSVFKVLALPLNPLNALIVGFLGLPGLILIYVITIFF